MKLKIFAMVLALLMLASLCACTYTDPNGNQVKANDGEVAMTLEGEFKVVKVEWSAYAASSLGAYRLVYTAVLEHDGYRMIVDIEPEQYAFWNVGDTIEGRVVSTYSNANFGTKTRLYCGDSTMLVHWIGKED